MDSNVDITAGTGTSIDTRTEGTNGNHRQVVVLGDPSTNAGVAPVDATAGLKVNLGDDNDVTVSGTVTVDGSGVTQPVSGTVTANLSATDNAVLDNIDADTSAIQTAVELIDDAVYTDGTGTPSKGLAVMGTDGTNPQIVSTNTSGHVNIADGGNAITVDNGGTFAVQSTLQTGSNTIGNIGTIATSVTPGTGATNLGKAVDGAAGGTDTGIATLAVRDDTTATLTPADGDYTHLRVNSRGALHVNLETNLDSTNDSIAVLPRTSGGLSIFRSIDLDETEEQVKGSAGQVYGWYIFNADASDTLYVKFYNATAANVTVGTTTPVMTIPVPSGAGANVEFTNGIEFDTAITVAATTGIADSDTGAPAANEVIVNVFYA